MLYAALAPETAAAEWRRRAEQLGVPVAAAARADRYEAIRYGSAAVAREGAPHGATPSDNLAVFADMLHPGSDVRVVRRELMPLGSA